jgi:hypothetical protein
MDVGAADRGCCDAHKRIKRANIGEGFFIKHNPARLYEYGGFHPCGHDLVPS